MLKDLLPHLMTIPSSPDKHTRAAFFDHMVGFAVFVGRTSTASYLLPVFGASLFDEKEVVLHSVLRALTALLELGLVRPKDFLNDYLRSVLPLLCHPSAWIRGLVVTLFECLRTLAGPAQWCVHVLPALAPLLTRKLPAHQHASKLTGLLKPPLARTEMQQALAQLQSDNGAGEIMSRVAGTSSTPSRTATNRSARKHL